MNSRHSVQYKEVFLRTPPAENWNEITLNTGGVSSTLQDVKAQQWSGTFVYNQISNRFIYWRSVDNVFELVEESLDVCLIGNQLRYKFVDSPVLNGVSITELTQQIVVLVPTISSLHKFTFPHPDSQVATSSSHSIFEGIPTSTAMDPSSYHVLGPTPSNIAHAASCISSNEDAIFSLALNNASVLLVRMTLEGSVSTSVLSQDSIMPRFLAGFTDALMRKDGHENVSSSLVFHSYQKHLYLFSLSCGGVLNAWCCQTGTSLSSINLAKRVGIPVAPSNKHMMMKGFMGKTFVICTYLHGSCLTAVNPTFNHNNLEFDTLSTSAIPQGLDLIHMTMGEYDDVWCCWLATGDEAALITRISWSEPDVWVSLAPSRPPTTVKPNKFICLDPASLFLKTICTSGFFTVEDIRKALTSYETTNKNLKRSTDIRSFIHGIVESEIFSELGEQSVDDHVFLRVSERCWSRIYACCSQHIIAGSLTLSLAWLGNGNLVLVQDSGFSLATRCDFFELFWNCKATCIAYPHVTYGRLLEILRDANLGDALERVLLGLSLGQPLQPHLDEALKLVPLSSSLTEKCTLISQEDMKECFAELVKELSSPEDCVLEAPDWKAFGGPSGLTAITQLFRDYVTTRLNISVNLLVMMSLTGHDFMLEYKELLMELSRIYYVLHWMCVTNVDFDTPIIQSYILTQQTQTMQNTMEDSVLALVNVLWPRMDNEVLVNYLFAIRQYSLIQDLSRIVRKRTWNSILAESFLAVGEYDKAYETCMSEFPFPVSHYLKVVRLFEVHSRPDYAVSVATKALEVCSEISSTDLETIQFILFIHQLQLKRFDEAYEIIESCHSWQRKIDSLYTFVSTLMGEGKFEKLISYPYIGLVNQVDDFLTTRARSLPFVQAVNFYNVLYAFHVKEENFKKAASVMFEKGIRSDSCEMQWRCYGIALNCLTLVDPSQAWILRPKPTSAIEEGSVEVLDINEVRKEFELSGIRYNLGNCPPDATKEEVVTLCISQQQFKAAMRLSSMCGLSGSCIIESLAAACSTVDYNENWHWLRQNEIEDFIATKDNYRDMVWRILRRFIEKYELGQSTELHRAAANKLLSLEMFLPAWLSASYCKRNATELLKLYLHHGYLEECSMLAVDYLKAGMGIGKEAFGIESPLLPNSFPLWLPLYTIDRVLQELQHYKLEGELEKTLDEFILMARRVSNDKKELLRAVV